METHFLDIYRTIAKVGRLRTCIKNAIQRKKMRLVNVDATMTAMLEKNATA